MNVNEQLLAAAEQREQDAYLGDPDAIARRMVGDDGLIRHLSPHKRDDAWSLVADDSLPERVEGVRRYIADAIRAAIDHDRQKRGGGWRPASEPPGNSRDVLIRKINGFVRAGYYMHTDGCWYIYHPGIGSQRVDLDELNCWCQAPPPPEGAR